MVVVLDKDGSATNVPCEVCAKIVGFMGNQSLDFRYLARMAKRYFQAWMGSTAGHKY